MEKGQVATFLSRSSNLQIHMRGPQMVSLPNGLYKYDPGLVIEFRQGKYSTTDPEIINWLVNRDRYGIDYFRSDAQEAEELRQANSKKTISGSRGAEAKESEPPTAKKSNKLTEKILSGD